jgi:hypothetical protein
MIRYTVVGDHKTKCAAIGRNYSILSEAEFTKSEAVEETGFEPARVAKAFCGIQVPVEDFRG